MSSTVIYYFTGSGNSLAVARDIAERLDAKLIPVASTLDQEHVDTDADGIGFVFPLYDFKPPPPIDDLVDKLGDISDKYLFAVCTYGITAARSMHQFGKLIASRGGRLSAGFAVAMPHNGLGSSAVTESDEQSLFKGWRDRRDEVCEYINARKAGRIESSSLLLVPFQRRFLRMLPSALKFARHALLKGVDSLAFVANDDCNSCGICEKVCTAANIEIVDGKPVWSDRCVSCFACVHWCPQEAITLGGFTMDIRCYHHPEVKLADMVRQR
jgi:flavodoxin/ferredoxin